MKQKWYEQDWDVCIFVAGLIILGVIGNYFSHGGRFVW